MAKEYIEREKAQEVIKNYGKNAIDIGQKTLDPVDDIILIRGAVGMIPIADVVEVVRCKDCKYWDNGRCEGIKNGLVVEYTAEDDYCSYGERKESEVDTECPIKT